MLVRSARTMAKAALLASLLAVTACASTETDGLAFKEEPADVIYNEALALLNSGQYAKAAARFENLDEQHPYSDYAKQGLVLTTFAYYTQGKYDEAISTGRRYVTLHPSSDDAPYVQYLVAQSYFKQIADVSKDQERTHRALQALDELIRRYPDSEYVDDARAKQRVVYDQLAGKEMTVGRYYLERRNYTGAINRFRVVVSEYQATRHVEEALMRLVESYLALGIVNEAQTAAAILGHNFPDSEWYKDAHQLLSSGGLEPRESSDSWISRAFKGFVPL